MSDQEIEHQKKLASKLMLVYTVVILGGILLFVLLSHFFHFRPSVWHFHITRPPAPQ